MLVGKGPGGVFVGALAGIPGAEGCVGGASAEAGVVVGMTRMRGR